MKRKYNTADAILAKSFRYSKSSLNTMTTDIKIQVLKHDKVTERYISVNPVSLILDHNEVIK